MSGRRIGSAVAAGALGLSLVVVGASVGGGGPVVGDAQLASAASSAQETLDANPCLMRARRKLRCPDLKMRPPFGLTIDRRTRPGRVLLRGGNSIDSLGSGPVELYGIRNGKKTMEARQRIYRRSGTKLSLRTGARLYFYPIPGQYRYWKVSHAAKFELWRLDRRNRRTRLVKTGPKVYYCFRDLRRTHPSGRSPSGRVYPGCSQNPRERRVVLGTSVGWSDIYPPSYHEQWIDVTGLRGRFAYVHIADPKNGIYESDEENNEGETLVRLPSGRVYGGRQPRRPKAEGEPAPEPGEEYEQY